MTAPTTTPVNLDLDGCAYDFSRTFGDFCAARLEQPRERFSAPQTWEFWTQWGMTREFWAYMFDEYITAGGFDGAPPVQGFTKTVELLRRHGHRVFIITARGCSIYGSATTNAQARKSTVDWLNRHGVEHDGLIFTAHKQNVSDGIYVDDYSKHLHDIREAGKTAIAFDAPHNQDWSGMRATSWYQVYEIIRSLQSAPTSFGDRL